MLQSSHRRRNKKKGDEALLLVFYSEDDVSNGFGAENPKRGSFSQIIKNCVT
jgi:hypothetical protein